MGFGRDSCMDGIDEFSNMIETAMDVKAEHLTIPYTS